MRGFAHLLAWSTAPSLCSPPTAPLLLHRAASEQMRALNGLPCSGWSRKLRCQIHSIHQIEHCRTKVQTWIYLILDPCLPFFMSFFTFLSVEKAETLQRLIGSNRSFQIRCLFLDSQSSAPQRTQLQIIKQQFLLHVIKVWLLLETGTCKTEEVLTGGSELLQMSESLRIWEELETSTARLKESPRSQSWVECRGLQHQQEHLIKYG